jgi:hypothetical protein
MGTDTEHPRGASAGRIVVGSAWVAVGTTLLLFRQAGVPSVDTIWAEDGEVYLTDAALVGPLRPLLSPVSGYLTLLPRLMAGMVSVLPVRWAAVLLAVGSAIVLSGLSLYVYAVARWLLVSVWSRAILAGMVILLPALVWDGVTNATNLQWSLILPCVLALWVPPASRAQTIVSSALAVLAVTSSPATLLLLPLAALRLARPTSRRAAVVAVAFMGGAVLQLVVSFLGADEPFRAPTDPLALPGLYGLRVAGALLTGEWAVPLAWSTLGPAFGYAMLAIAGLVIALGSVRVRNVRPLAIAGASIAFYFVPVVVRGTSLVTPMGQDLDLAVGSRWAVAPILLLLLAVVIGIDPHLRDGTATRWRLPSLVLAVLLTASVAVAALLGFRVTNARSPGPRWSEGLVSAADTCLSDEVIAVIPVSPPGWNAVVPCDRIDGAQALVATTSIWRPKSGHRILRER